jgi:hypothetical protein
MIISPLHTIFPKVALLTSLMLLCIIILGGSTDVSQTKPIIHMSEMEKDSVILRKLETKIKQYEITRKP